MLIREATVDDAEMFLSLVKKVESESNYMLLEAGERKTSLEEQRKLMIRLQQQDKSKNFCGSEGEQFDWLFDRNWRQCKAI